MILLGANAWIDMEIDGGSEGWIGCAGCVWLGCALMLCLLLWLGRTGECLIVGWKERLW